MCKVSAKSENLFGSGDREVGRELTINLASVHLYRVKTIKSIFKQMRKFSPLTPIINIITLDVLIEHKVTAKSEKTKIGR